MPQISILNRQTLLFPLALVLFEFCVYITNDLIQPAMIIITQEYGVDASWNASAMSAFLFGGVILQWLFGPLSDRVGRRRVLLSGVAFFMVCCLLTWWAGDIYQFLALRVLQGVALSFIGSVGHAVIQEAFEEKTAVQISALMANVAMIAPLLGPVIGSVFVAHLPWRWAFVMIAALASIAFFGLFLHMPETVKPSHSKLPVSRIMHDFVHLLGHKPFMTSTLSLPLMSIPLVAWIALAPTIMISNYHLSSYVYGLAQIPIFGCLILSNLVMANRAKKWLLGVSVRYSHVFFILGTVWMLLAGFGVAPMVLMVIAIATYAFAEGLAMSVLYRFSMTASDRPFGVTSALIGMLHMTGYALGVELFKYVYLTFGLFGFGVCSVFCIVLFIILSRHAVMVAMTNRAVV